MAKQRSDRADEYHKQFGDSVIRALEKGTAPWQKPWQPGERVLPHNFSTGRDYRGGNAVYLALQAIERGYTDPRWGGYRQVEQAGGHVRKGEKGTPIMYVEFDRRVQVRDARGKPVLDGEGRPTFTREKRDRPLTKIQHVFNVEQTEGLKLRPLDRAAPEWEGHQRAEAVMRNSGVRIDHVAGDRAYYNHKADRVVLPERGQFPSQAAFTHTALHELGHATGHEKRLDRPTLTNHGGFGSETYAREELRAEISAMMAGEKLGVGHEPRHGHAYVASWVKALENDPREIRAACVDAQKMSDWLVARERERVVEKEQPAQEQARAGKTPVPEPERAAPPGRDDGRAAPGDVAKELEAALRGAGARGYEQGYRDAAAKRAPEPWASAREAVPQFAGERTPAGVELRYVLERAHSQGYERGFDDRTKGRTERPVQADATAAEVGDRGRALWEELRKVQREHGAASYLQGYDDAAGDRAERRPGRSSGDVAQDLIEDVRARGYKHGYGEGVSGAVPRDVAVRKAEQAVSYAAVARFGKHNQAREEELARRGVEQPDRTGTDGGRSARPVQETDRTRGREVERDPAPSR